MVLWQETAALNRRVSEMQTAAEAAKTANAAQVAALTAELEASKAEAAQHSVAVRELNDRVSALQAEAKAAQSSSPRSVDSPREASLKEQVMLLKKVRGMDGG